MEKESKLIAQFQDAINRENSRVENKKNSDLLTANNQYNKLVENGLIKKRGYTLRGIDDTHLFNVSLKRF